MDMQDENKIITTLDIQVLVRKSGEDWREIDRGPGVIHLPAGMEIAVRIKGIGDDELKTLVNELTGCPGLVFLNLSENRNIDNDGLAYLHGLPGLRALNLSSCSITNSGLEFLKGLPKLETLDLTYCNRLTDDGIKALRALVSLKFIDIQGCIKITNGGLARLRRKGLTIHK